MPPVSPRRIKRRKRDRHQRRAPRRYSAAERIEISETAVHLSDAEHLPLKSISNLLGISASLLCVWRKRYRAGGREALLPKPRMKPRRYTPAERCRMLGWAFSFGLKHYSKECVSERLNVNIATLYNWRRLWRKNYFHPLFAVTGKEGE